MKKQQIFAYACSAALLGTLIGCGQKTEIDQSVPDTIIEVAKTTAVLPEIWKIRQFLYKKVVR